MFSSFSTPKAMDGIRIAKYRNRVVDMVFCSDFGPVTPEIQSGIMDMVYSVEPGQQIRSKIESFQNANFLISQTISMRVTS